MKTLQTDKHHPRWGGNQLGIMWMLAASALVILVGLPITKSITKNLSQPVIHSAEATPSSDDKSKSTVDDLLHNTLLLGGLLALIGWSAKETLSYYAKRAELVVLDMLSDEVPLPYESLLHAVRTHPLYRESWYVRWYIKDALANLVSVNRVAIRNRRFSIVSDK